MTALKSICLFIFAGACEIGGGYLMWMWLRQGSGVAYGLAGMGLLVLYGIAITFQPADFGRTYAAYGSLFIVMSLLWAYSADGLKPDRYDVIGALVVLAGAGMIYFGRRI